MHFVKTGAVACAVDTSVRQRIYLSPPIHIGDGDATNVNLNARSLHASRYLYEMLIHSAALSINPLFPTDPPTTNHFLMQIMNLNFNMKKNARDIIQVYQFLESFGEFFFLHGMHTVSSLCKMLF